ncbi:MULTISPECIES: carbohydrate ABC transporter permease [Paenibacillus]|jgi:raffinose/stachyose/melibiose transport system permease protein|uniref:Multiple sugar transport system permease n=2 Tax=Paenibacillus barengoltzii TaxID=343517 RepID=R9L5S4_9BACL|nr:MULTISPECIES: carbohydrate ABC transporter permease [Paenibacillus]EOS54030.1 multiple sugar transport system permease [Paenibacillus barengoltzii G22]MDU0331358.1 carbohydrate ABC transporter permease [Paenibacillus sp. 3LSP]MEC2343814.1 carbohydrate ABC transporter permease [Paenibacillus barengoltzii]SMF20309.1 raffinose/stachyose/melibiose transport system permease protein [Paenibacillus barengoltzii]SMF48695.1 raffinose/stachyose/melibiose transport system permease protein [Paenibacill
MKKNTAGRIVLEIVMVLLSILFLYPLFLTIINSLKSFSEVMTDVIALPKKLAFENYSYVWEFINYPRLFLNNAVVTILGLAGIILISSIAAYKLARTKSKASSIIYFICIMPMLIPFQSIMLTVLQMAKNLHLSDSTWGLGILYWGFGAPLALFIYHGFVKGIPKEIDESATIDGASGFRLFFSVIFPLLKSVTTTIIIIDVMWIWNDFLLPLLMVNGSPATKTLTLAAYTFVGQYTSDWQYAMTAMVMAVLPSIIVFIFLQKYIVKGVVAGAVKG